MTNELFPSLYFHHVAVNVPTSKYQRVVSFYLALGMKLYFEWETENEVDLSTPLKHCFIDCGSGPCLEIHTNNQTDDSANKIPHFCFHVDAVDEVYQTALKHGAVTISAPENLILEGNRAPIHCRVCHMFGPGGENIELINWHGYDPYQ